MSSKTKIVVLHMKELIYTAIFAALGILLIILLIVMFAPKKQESKPKAVGSTESSYIPGVYTSSIVLNNNAIDIEVTVDENNINSVRLVSLDEAVATMYPLIEPSFNDIVSQIYQNQTLEGLTYSDDAKYTTMVLMESIKSALNKATVKEPLLEDSTSPPTE